MKKIVDVILRWYDLNDLLTDEENIGEKKKDDVSIQSFFEIIRRIKICKFPRDENADEDKDEIDFNISGDDE